MMQQLLASFIMIVQLLMSPVQLASAVKADVKEVSHKINTVNVIKINYSEGILVTT
jgi:hypothetical protein